MINNISNYVSIHHAWNVTFGSAIVCAAASAEMGIRAAIDVLKMMGTIEKKQNEDVSYNFSANLGGSLFYGLCAANIIPGTSIVGASIFSIYSVCVYDPKKSVEDQYITTKIIGAGADLAKTLLNWTWNHIVSPICEHIICPVLRKIFNVVTTILSYISLPKHPIWYALGALATAIVVAKFALPALGIVLL